MSPSCSLSPVLRIAHRVHVHTSYYCLIPLLRTVSFPASVQLNRVQVRPLLHVTVELTMKQTSNTRNSQKYTFARSVKIPTKSEYRFVRNDVRTWREALLFVGNRKKAHKMAKNFKNSNRRNNHGS